MRSRIGADKNVNVDRIFLIYNEPSIGRAECQYPAKLFENMNDSRRDELMREVAFLGTEKVLIERHVRNIYDTQDGTYYTNYWIELERDWRNNVVGLLGLQVSMKAYDRLIPPAVLEDPFGISMLKLYNKE